MSDFKNIVEFFRLNRRYEEAEKSYSQNNKTTLTILETKEDYEIDKQQYNGLKLLRDIFQLFSTTEVFILNNPSGKEFYVKTNLGAYFNIATEQLNTNITLTSLYAVPLEDFPFEIYFYDSVRNCVVIDAGLIKNVQIVPESIRYDPSSDLLEDFGQQETLSYSYQTHKTWIYEFVSFFIPTNDPEGDPFAKQVSDNDVTVTQTRITELINIIPIIRESIGKYYANYNVYKKDNGKIIPFYLNRNNFSSDSTSVVSLSFNSLGAFMAYLNDTIFSQTDNFTFGKRPAFIDQYKEIVILPLIRNLESKSTFSYYDALQALYYLPESLFYMLPEGFLWKFFDKAIANDSFTNKPYSKEEDIFLKILKVLVSTDQNAVKFIERLNKRVSEKDPQMLLEFFNSRIHGNNFIEFADIVNKAWRKTRFVDANIETNPEYKSTNGPKFLPYHSEKIAGFFFSNVSASFENSPNDKKERFLRFKFETGKTKKVTRAHPKAVIYQDDEEIIEYYYYHPFYPVKIKNTDEDNGNHETAIKLDAIVPAFMLFVNSNKQFWHNVIKSGEYALDIAVIAGSYGTLSGIAAGEIISTLAVVRGMGAIAGITSSVANIVLKLANAEDSVLGQAFCEYLFWIEMLSLSGELTIAIRNGLRKSGKEILEHEDDLRKAARNADEVREIDNFIAHLDETLGYNGRRFAKKVNILDDVAHVRIKQFESANATAEVENALIFNSSRKISEFWTSNLKHTIIFPERIIRKMLDAIVTHNHPRGFDLSITDIMMLLRNNLAEVRAVTPNGDIFSMKFTGRMRDKGRIIQEIEEIQDDFTKTGGSLEDEFEQVYNAIKDHVEYIHYTKQ